ncbi:hypothetical protein QVH35_02895 [Candidatus Nitrosotenuis chungbukensis]|uniref:hypothetical protein n=1 Tax=Candidatus Nitrosotenuis chungbukensis TaxID=1353246 RepID=UPI0005B27CBF|nr:hypothetical protein [Candidatus Nitrosotenuis chungbukensis]WKT58390.1 hypothetical protein QVH35_02895 [Candidatus Nitrosotenuis chungbukensis]
MLLCASLFLLIFSGFSIAYAFEPIPITVSGTLDKIIFDGKWTHEFEWKASSLNTYSYDDEQQIVLRSAHQGDFVYIFLDAITDYHLDELNDHAVICFDTKNDKTAIPNSDDYCFMTWLKGKDNSVYNGNETSLSDNYFQKISNPIDFVGISAISDTNDRYTPIPHPSYEFRIPTDLIGRKSVYGFYFLVYDGHLKKSYTYPENIKLENSNTIPNPNVWGEIYSPDKSLPEFDLPILSLFLSTMLIVYLTQVKMRNGKINYK